MDPESQIFHDILKRDLVAAMKARQTDAVAALRSAISSIDNAQAVENNGFVKAETSQYVAVGGEGVGSTEVQRRQLSVGDIHQILQTEIGDRTVEAARYDTYGEAEAADRLRREVDILATYLSK